MDINNKNLWVFDIGGVEVWITQTIVNTWIIMGVLILIAILIRLKLRKFEEVPNGKIQNIIESLIEFFDKYLKDTVGEKHMYLGNWFFAAFIFILISNLSGMVGMRPPTADWTTAFAFAFSTFVMIQIFACKYRGWEYIKSFFTPNPVFLPINLIGELARPISLSFRLFGNVLAGMILMALLYSLLPTVLTFFIPVPLHAFFDVFSGVLQTYIFITLSMTFISAATVAD